jgi:hypothetical protein
LALAFLICWMDGSPTTPEVPELDSLKSRGKGEQFVVVNVVPLVLICFWGLLCIKISTTNVQLTCDVLGAVTEVLVEVG